MTAPAYATEQEAAGRLNIAQADQVESLAGLLLSASRIVDRDTGTWFWERPGTLKIQAERNTDRLLFLPAPIVTLESLEEDGQALTAGTDFVDFGAYLEKTSGCWSPRPQAVVLTGTFGTVGDKDLEIAKSMAIEIGAALGGWKTTTAISGVADAAVEPKSGYPEWLTKQARSYAAARAGVQPFVFVDAPEEEEP